MPDRGVRIDPDANRGLVREGRCFPSHASELVGEARAGLRRLHVGPEDVQHVARPDALVGIGPEGAAERPAERGR